MTDEPRRPLNARHSDDAEAYGRLRDTWLNQRRADYVLASMADLPPGSRVVEIGAGTGKLLRDLAQRRPDLTFMGVEPLSNYVDLARRRVTEDGLHNVEFLLGTGEDLHELEQVAQVDMFLANDTLHHVVDEAEVAARLAAAGRPGTRWLAIEPSVAHPYVFVRHSLEPGERNFFPGRFRAAAQRAGWTLTSQRHLFLIPPKLRRPPGWAKAVERRLEGVRGLAGGVAMHLVLDGGRVPAD